MEDREEIKKAAREASFTFWTFFKWALPIIAALVVLGFILQAAGIISIGIQREVIQHSQPYVETKVSLLNKLHVDWLQLDSEIAELKTRENTRDVISAKEAQKKSIIIRLHEEAELIPESQVPRSIKEFLRTHPLYPR